MSLYRFSDTSLKRREGVDQRIISISDFAIQISPIDFGIARDGGKRTAERQYELFLAGASRCDGESRLSAHQFGKALDFFAWVDGRESWNPGHLAMVAAAHLQAASMLGFKLKWGGFYTPFHADPFNHGWDCGHIELIES